MSESWYADDVIDQRRRRRMVRAAQRAGASEAVCAAMMRVPRHWFVTADARSLAYEDSPVPIGCGQTISRDFSGSDADLVRDSARFTCMDVGCGSCYVAALLACLLGPHGRVLALERQQGLVRAVSRLVVGYSSWSSRIRREQWHRSKSCWLMVACQPARLLDRIHLGCGTVASRAGRAAVSGRHYRVAAAAGGWQ